MDPLPLQVVTHPLYLKQPDEFLHTLHLVHQILSTHRDLSLEVIQEKCIVLEPKINQEILIAVIRLQQQFTVHPPPQSVPPADEIFWDNDSD
jgi:hypothetical protein